MSEPDLVFANTAVELKSAPILPEWVIEGDPKARNCILSQSHDRMAITLMWDCSPGRFRWVYDVDETIHILEGGVTLTQTNGSVKRLGPGDVVFFPAGSSAIWEVHGYVRKLAFFRFPLPRPVSLFLRAWRKAAGLADGAGKGMGPAATLAAGEPVFTAEPVNAPFAFAESQAA